MKPWKTIFLIGSTMIISACGGGGGSSGGGSGGSSSTSVQAAISAGLTEKTWIIPLASNQYGNCALAAQFSSTGKFGATFICQNGTGMNFLYELVLGSYEINGSKITLIADTDSCSTKDTFFWETSSSSNRTELDWAVSGNLLYLSFPDGVLGFKEMQETDRDDFPFVAQRACFVDKGANYQWEAYPTSNSTEDIQQKITDHLNGSVAKISNNNPNVVPPSPINGSGCYAVPQHYNSSITLGFSGSISQSYNGIIANLNLYSATTGFPGGYTNTYYRQNNMTQDRVDLALNGGSVYAQVTLSAGTVALIAASGGSSQGEVCGFYLNTGIVNPPITSGAWTGHLGGGQIGVVTKSGQFIQL